jgi:hypothetical protein
MERCGLLCTIAASGPPSEVEGMLHWNPRLLALLALAALVLIALALGEASSCDFASYFEW